MKLLTVSMVLLLSVSFAQAAGPITSGGVSNLLESCADASGNYKLEVTADVDNGLVASLIDSSGLDSIMNYTSSVQASTSDDGYVGEDMKISFHYVKELVSGKKKKKKKVFKYKKIATVLVGMNSLNQLPLTFANLICAPASLK